MKAALAVALHNHPQERVIAMQILDFILGLLAQLVAVFVEILGPDNPLAGILDSLFG